MVNAIDIRADQRRRRRRARITQREMAAAMDISLTSVAKYELGGDLPFDYTPDDYEAELVRLIAEKGK